MNMQPELDKNSWSKACEQGRPFLIIRRLADDLTTPVAAILKMGADRPWSFLLESVKGGESRGRYSILGLDPARLFRIEEGIASIAGPDGNFMPVSDEPIGALDAFVRDADANMTDAHPAAPMLQGVFGYMGYDMVALTDDIPLPAADDATPPQALLILPRSLAVFDAVQQEILLVRRLEPVPPAQAQGAWDTANQELDELQAKLLAPLQSGAVTQHDAEPREIQIRESMPHDRFRFMVAKGKDYIRAGDAFQIVLSQKFHCEFPHSPFSLYRALRKSNPSPFMFFLNMEGFSIVGASPEILVRVREGEVTVRPIAGTRPRGKTQEEDLILEAQLLADEKERAEHLMLVDLARNDVGRVSEAGTVEVTRAFFIERYSRVMHIVSNVTGKLRRGMSNLYALFAGFPHGTVSGAPKIRAMQIITELEGARRGIYAGCIGYISANGDMDTCIALRTGIVRDGVLHVQAGGGIVLDSDEEMERMESVHKASAVFDAAREAWRFDGGET